MEHRHVHFGILSLVTLAGAGCSHATQNVLTVTTPAPVPAATPPIIRTGASAVADSVRHGFTQADVDFMSGMISHHAQALVMARWAPTHTTNPEVQRLSARIINAQSDEIRTMQTWLSDQRQVVPEADPAGMRMTMNGMTHTMLMPGMLTPDQMRQLDQARGKEWDRLFLTLMIQHHRGAISMVEQLFGAPGAAQNDLVFKFASDVQADQSTEVTRMQSMLLAMGAPPAPSR
ncbi:MAG: DUF305 domain-containing protein [Gemmatimonadota bacterium]